MHIKLLVLALCVSSSLASFEVSGKRDDRQLWLTKDGNKKYYFDHSRQLNFFNAMLECASLDMQLATAYDAVEFSRLNDFIVNNRLPNINVWIAATDLGQEGKFQWMTNGQDVTVNEWAPGQPDNDGGVENCIVLNYQLNQRVTMHDTNCAGVWHFICESKPNNCIDTCEA